MTFAEALADHRLLGALPAFRDLSSWGRWRVFAKAMYGEPLTPEEETVFRQHTGRSRYAPPVGGWKEVVCIVGRQSGKSRVAASLADYAAITAEPEADGTDLYALLIAQDQRGALRTLLSYARAPFVASPVLARVVVGQTADTLKLDNGVTIAAYPCRPAAVRGLRARVVVCDELAFFRSTEGNPVDVEMLRALRPTLATTGGRLVILSSPYGQFGALWDLHRLHYGRDGAPVLVWQASAPEMHPTLPADYLARMQQDDPDAYRSEVLGEFRAGVASLLDPEALDTCVAEGVRERQPVDGLAYVGYADPSGGRRDRFTVAVAHHDSPRAVLDAVRAWAPPFNPSEVVAEAAEFLARYGVAAVVGDRYSAEFVAGQFRAHGIAYVPAERDKSAVYLEFLALVNADAVALLDVPDMLREFRGLERRRGASGRDRVDHGPGSHDDLANSAAGALVLAASVPAAVNLEPSEEELAQLRGVFERPGDFWLPAGEMNQW
jgi:hypothetical protein